MPTRPERLGARIGGSAPRDKSAYGLDRELGLAIEADHADLRDGGRVAEPSCGGSARNRPWSRRRSRTWSARSTAWWSARPARRRPVLPHDAVAAEAVHEQPSAVGAVDKPVGERELLGLDAVHREREALLDVAQQAARGRRDAVQTVDTRDKGRRRRPSIPSRSRRAGAGLGPGRARRGQHRPVRGDRGAAAAACPAAPVDTRGQVASTMRPRLSGGSGDEGAIASRADARGPRAPARRPDGRARPGSRHDLPRMGRAVLPPRQRAARPRLGEGRPRRGARLQPRRMGRDLRRDREGGPGRRAHQLPPRRPGGPLHRGGRWGLGRSSSRTSWRASSRRSARTCPSRPRTSSISANALPGRLPRLRGPGRGGERQRARRARSRPPTRGR